MVSLLPSYYCYDASCLIVCSCFRPQGLLVEKSHFETYTTSFLIDSLLFVSADRFGIDADYAHPFIGIGQLKFPQSHYVMCG